MDISEKMFLVGDVFMRRFYTIFDRDQNRVGLASAKGYEETAVEISIWKKFILKNEKF